MPVQDRIPDRALGMTKEELAEDDEFDADEHLEAEEEFREHVGTMHAAFEVYAAGILLARMFDDGYITLGKYLELVEYVEEYERDLEATLL